MLNQLIESREHFQESARRGKFLFSTLTIAVMLCTGGLVWSLFAKDLGIGDESFELSRLVAPVVETAEEPPVVEEPKTPEVKQTSPQSQSSIATRKVNMAATDETQFVPKEISTKPAGNQSRPKEIFTIGADNTSGAVGNSQGTNRGGNVGTQNISSTSGIKPTIIDDKPEMEEVAPTLKKSAPPVEEDKRKVIQSLGVINGKATYLPKPDYTAAARTIRASGEVNVQVMIDETGRVISARAVSGHPVLRAISENAAKNARFDPTYLSKVPVKVTGVIVYKFSLN